MPPPNINSPRIEIVLFGITAAGVYLPFKVTDDGTGKGILNLN